jgi:hypothetical protein
LPTNGLLLGWLRGGYNAVNATGEPWAMEHAVFGNQKMHVSTGGAVFGLRASQLPVPRDFQRSSPQGKLAGTADTLGLTVTSDRSYVVRHMSRAQAAAEAMRLARDLLASAKSEHWELTAVNAAPCSFAPNLVGKTPSRWIVTTYCKMLASPESVMDGGDPMIFVDLLTETASFDERGSENRVQ